ncbi:MAG: DUF2007 domain-containing protein [Anaerolineales bacterium]|jgi:hypothetical protein|nr:DUF2007 domain-containing protein [Anaerolineales bacterium]
MSDTQWEVLEQVSGSVAAEVLKGLLTAQGINVVLSQEGIGDSVYPVSVGPLSEIQILVPSDQLETAQKIMQDYQAGVYENLVFPDLPDDTVEESSEN